MKKALGSHTVKSVLGLFIALSLTLGLIKAANSAEKRVETLRVSMSVEEKVCQMLMPAFRYWNDPDGNQQKLETLNDEIAGVLERYGFGGVIFFAQNAEETEKAVRLADAMQTANAKGDHRAQLLTAIDQEGGSVTRLGQGTAFSGNMALGAADDERATAAVAQIIGEELKSIGFNFDFAPVVDINNNPANPVIGARSFSDDAAVTARHGVAFMKALMKTGAIATLKHFPGHGDTAVDSHTGLPRIDKTYDELKANELIPFQACIDAGVEAIMTAHIQYPAIETETYVSKDSGEAVSLPATFSKTILTDILRGDMGFQGVIVTDSMEMGAVSKNFDSMDAARFAIAAGTDILLIPVDSSVLADSEGLAKLADYISALTALVENDVALMEKVDAAVTRILLLKERHGLLDAYENPDLETRVEEAAAFVGSAEHHETEWEIAKKAVTLVKNHNGLLPVSQNNQKIAVLTAYDNEVLGMNYAVGRLRDEGKLPDGTEVTVTSIRNKELADCLPLVKDARHVIAVSEIGGAAALKNAHAALLDALMEQVHKDGHTFTILSASLPYDAARYPDADAIMLAWSARGMSQDPRERTGPISQYGASMPAALYQALSPNAVFTGKLPVNIPALDENFQYADETLYARGSGLTGEETGVAVWVNGKVRWFTEELPAKDCVRCAAVYDKNGKMLCLSICDAPEKMDLPPLLVKELPEQYTVKVFFLDDNFAPVAKALSMA